VPLLATGLRAQQAAAQSWNRLLPAAQFRLPKRMCSSSRLTLS